MGIFPVRISKKISIWIKASGKWFENADKENVYVELNLDKGMDWLNFGRYDFPSDWKKLSCLKFRYEHLSKHHCIYFLIRG